MPPACLGPAGEGDLRIWNFSNGSCLTHLRPHGGRRREKDGNEVTGVSFVAGGGFHARHLISVGWDRKVTFWEDSAARLVEPTRQLTGHEDDILCLALNPPSVLATGTVLPSSRWRAPTLAASLAPPPLLTRAPPPSPP